MIKTKIKTWQESFIGLIPTFILLLFVMVVFNPTKIEISLFVLLLAIDHIVSVTIIHKQTVRQLKEDIRQ